MSGKLGASHSSIQLIIIVLIIDYIDQFGGAMPKRMTIHLEVIALGAPKRIRLQAVKAAPAARAVTRGSGKHAREMALVNEAAKQGNIGELAAWVP